MSYSSSPESSPGDVSLPPQATVLASEQLGSPVSAQAAPLCLDSEGAPEALNPAVWEQISLITSRVLCVCHALSQGVCGTGVPLAQPWNGREKEGGGRGELERRIWLLGENKVVCPSANFKIL